MSKQSRLNRFISAVQNLNTYEPPLPPEMANLLSDAMSGKTFCPYDESNECRDCDCHDVHTVNNLIIRVGKEKGDLCCNRDRSFGKSGATSNSAMQ